MKLSVIVFSDEKQIYQSTVHKEVNGDFAATFLDGYDESCGNIPLFEVKWFFKRLVGYFEYKGDFYIFISSRLTQQELGRVEHCIYTLTKLRGQGNHIDKLEFIASPNTPMKKFLMKRV